MSAPLYNAEILRLAAATARYPRLAKPTGSGEGRSALCGSRAVIDIAFTSGRVDAIGMEVRSCALGQASAALLAEHICGKDRADLVNAYQALKACLAGGTEEKNMFWPGMEVLQRARAYPARHAAILLPYEASIMAIEASCDHMESS